MKFSSRQLKDWGGYKANEYFQTALIIAKEIGHRRGEASAYGNLGTVLQSTDEYIKAKEYHEKALTIRKEICDIVGEAVDYLNIGTAFFYMGEYLKAEGCFTKGLAISEEIGNVEKQFLFLCNLAWVRCSEGKIQEVFSLLLSSIQKCEDLRGFLQDNDRFKISLSEKYAFPYWALSALFCDAGILIKLCMFQSLGEPDLWQIYCQASTFLRIKFQLILYRGLALKGSWSRKVILRVSTSLIPVTIYFCGLLKQAESDIFERSQEVKRLFMKD